MIHNYNFHFDKPDVSNLPELDNVIPREPYPPISQYNYKGEFNHSKFLSPSQKQKNKQTKKTIQFPLTSSPPMHASHSNQLLSIDEEFITLASGKTVITDRKWTSRSADFRLGKLGSSTREHALWVIINSRGLK